MRASRDDGIVQCVKTDRTIFLRLDLDLQDFTECLPVFWSQSYSLLGLQLREQVRQPLTTEHPVITTRQKVSKYLWRTRLCVSRSVSEFVALVDLSSVRHWERGMPSATTAYHCRNRRRISSICMYAPEAALPPATDLSLYFCNIPLA